MVSQIASCPVSKLNRQTGKPANRQTNKQLFNEAKRYIAGGVNSPVRAFKAVGRGPIFIKKARGSQIFSEDGQAFIDYCMSFGALILGHSHPKVIKELKGAIENGTTFGAPTKLETELARVIVQAIPSIERLRLTNSGTEAVMGAVRLARAFTRRNKIIKFSGSYHGHTDYLLDCLGVPADFRKHTLMCPYNNIRKVEETVKKFPKDIAAIIVEPIEGNRGVVLPKEGFLQSLSRFTQRYNIVLIFDEVITGFRLTFGGVQKLFGIKPDLTCLGKIIGGGLPVGAFGGRKEIMQLLAPEGKVYQAGTFSGNPLTVTAGLATLRILDKTNPYKRLAELTENLCENIKEKAEEYGIKLGINSFGSLFSLCFEGNLFKRFYQGLLKEGIYFAPSPLEVNFLSCAHTKNNIEKTLESVDKVLRSLRR